MNDELHHCELIPPAKPYRLTIKVRDITLREYPKFSKREQHVLRNIRRVANRGNRRRLRYWKRIHHRHFRPWRIVIGPPSRMLLIENFSK